MKEDSHGAAAGAATGAAAGAAEPGEQGAAQNTQVTGGGEPGEPSGEATAQAADDYKAAIGKRDERIAELEAQVADAARSAEAAEKLREQIRELNEQAAAERRDFELRLAGARNAKAAAVLLDEHGGDVAALKAAEPWLFEEPTAAPQKGATGLEPAGAASSREGRRARWERIAGLGDED